MTPGKTFKLSKSTKRMMATIVGAEARNHYKRLMIEAQLCSEVVVKHDPKDKKPYTPNATKSS